MVMSLEEASAIVLAAARRDEPDDTMGDAPLLSYLRNVVSLDTLVPYDEDDPDDPVVVREMEAWRVFLAWHEQPRREDLYELVKLLLGEGVVELSTVQEVWLERIRQGDLA